MTGDASGRTQLLAGPYGALELLVTGSGKPVTVFAAGLGESITSTRPFGSGVAGSRAFFHFSGDAGDTGGVGDVGVGDDPSGGSGWERLGAELLAVADHVGATRAVGASMGAVAILSALTGPGRDPGRFERLVLLIPPGVNGARLRGIADLLEGGDGDLLEELLSLERPETRGDDPRAQAWRSETVARIAALGPRLLATLGTAEPPLTEERLATIRVPVLIVAQADDPVHPLAAAERLARQLPDATLATLPAGGLLTAHRSEVRDLIRGFLGRTSHFPG